MRLLVLFVIALGARPVTAQPSPPSPTGNRPGGEKAAANEALTEGGDERPWARGVSNERQQAAQVAFREGNVQLNNGLFVQAVDKYRSALTHWDHPAIHYNLALALLNLDQPIEVF